MSEWQPIETAPIDTEILVWDNQCVVAIKRGDIIGEYFVVADTYGFCEDGHIDDEPTHWMPLPDPPTRASDVRESDDH